MPTVMNKRVNMHWKTVTTNLFTANYRFRRSALPYFGTRNDGFLAMTVRNFLKKIFRISSTYVYVFKYPISCFVCCLNQY